MKVKISRILIVGLLALSSSAWAKSAQDLLLSDLQSGVKTLPRETFFYHYFELNVGFKNVEDTELRDYRGRQEYVLARLAKGGRAFNNFDHVSSSYAQAGPGLYLATDPFASSPGAAVDTHATFGGSLIEIKVRPGSKYLSVYTPFSISQSTIQSLVAEGYLRQESTEKVFPGGKFTNESLRSMTTPENINFRKLFVKLLADMNVNLVEYMWQSAAGPLCGWKDMRSAFVYIAETKPLDVSEVNLVELKGFPSVMVLTQIELEALQRNRKLISLLEYLRSKEKQYRGAGLFQGRRIRKEAEAKIESTYPDASELRKVKEQTFKCL